METTDTLEYWAVTLKSEPTRQFCWDGIFRHCHNADVVRYSSRETARESANKLGGIAKPMRVRMTAVMTED